jgi:hypothetical protein
MIQNAAELHGTRWILHSNQFSERGDSSNAMEVSALLAEHGASEVSLMFDREDGRNSVERIDEARALGLSIRAYGGMTEFRRELRAAQPTHFYNFTAGGLTDSNYSKNWPHRWRFGDYVVLNHVVFRKYEPHGDIYAYISDWLHEWALKAHASAQEGMALALARRLQSPSRTTNVVIGSLPLAVSVTPGDAAAFRRANHLPEDAFVLGRIGGADQFDDPVARAAVSEWVRSSSDRYFVAVNTPSFGSHPQNRFLPQQDRKGVRDFFSATNAQINGRLMGESFGLSIVEGLTLGVPTIAPNLCRNSRMDQHHIRVLGPQGWLYCNENDVLSLLSSFQFVRQDATARSLVGERFSRAAFGSNLTALLEKVR